MSNGHQASAIEQAGCQRVYVNCISGHLAGMARVSKKWRAHEGNGQRAFLKRISAVANLDRHVLRI